jgi:hypothetical protein
MQEIKELMDKYGADAVVEAIRGFTSTHVPKTATPLVDEDKLQATVYQLDTGVSEILEAGTAVEATYQNKAELLKQARQLETEVKLAEAAAIMEIQGTGKDAFVVVGGKRVALTNDTARDAYRRMASQEYRKNQAAIEADIRKIDIELAQKKDAYAAKLEALACIRAKANLQANILANLV